METKPVFEFSDSFKAEVEQVAQMMLEEGVESREIPNSDGQILVLFDSETFRQSDQAKVLAPYEVGEKKFVVLAK